MCQMPNKPFIYLFQSVYHTFSFLPLFIISIYLFFASTKKAKKSLISSVNEERRTIEIMIERENDRNERKHSWRWKHKNFTEREREREREYVCVIAKK